MQANTSGGPAASWSATSRARVMSWSAGTTSFTKPQCLASVVSNRRPVKSISMATWYGMRRGNLMVAASATVPELISGSANVACSAAMMMSAEIISSKPPPKAMPFTAAMTGLFSPGSSCRPPKPPTP